MFLEAFVSLHLHTSKISIWYAAAGFILREYSLCTLSGRKIIKSPDATDIDISPSSGPCQNIKTLTQYKLLYNKLNSLTFKKKKSCK